MTDEISGLEYLGLAALAFVCMAFVLAFGWVWVSL